MILSGYTLFAAFIFLNRQLISSKHLFMNNGHAEIKNWTNLPTNVQALLIREIPFHWEFPLEILSFEEFPPFIGTR